MTPPTKKSDKKIALNRKALRDYFVVERIEAGIELKGTEVKSIRNGSISLSGGFARIKDNQVFLYNVNIPLYDHGNQFNHDPERDRRLLLHKREIIKLLAQTEQKGQALVPLSMYYKKGKIKIELGLCKGKQQEDKRETLKRKTADREAERAIRRHH